MILSENFVSVVAEQLGITDRMRIIPPASAADDLGADSLDLVELVMALEEQFQVELNEEATAACKNLGELAELIDRTAGRRVATVAG